MTTAVALTYANSARSARGSASRGQRQSGAAPARGTCACSLALNTRRALQSGEGAQCTKKFNPTRGTTHIMQCEQCPLEKKMLVAQDTPSLRQKYAQGINSMLATKPVSEQDNTAMHEAATEILSANGAGRGGTGLSFQMKPPPKEGKRDVKPTTKKKVREVLVRSTLSQFAAGRQRTRRAHRRAPTPPCCLRPRSSKFGSNISARLGLS